MTSLPAGSHACKCPKKRHQPKLVVLTGGPGGGKTAILEMARRYFCRHVVLLPEAASIVFGGGFPRLDTAPALRAAQRAIFRVQRELELMAVEDHQACMVICDRGTLDGAAYWPGPRWSFYEQLGITLEEEMARYAAVIHIEVPTKNAYYHKNGIRHESLPQARAIDKRIARTWSAHPHQLLVSSQAGFLDKATYALELLRNEVPECCRTHLHALRK